MPVPVKTPHDPESQASALTDRPPSYVVGVGASAGGVEAFSQLLKALPADTGMAFVLLSHLSPTHRSELSRLFSPLTRMPVCDAGDGQAVEPDHVYVLPANRTLTIAEGRLRLAGRDGERGHPSAIDEFLESLAVDQGARAVGVILSGTGSDGTAGLRAIKARGGATFAQDPFLAAFDGMPRSAMQSGAVDRSLPVDGIATALEALSTSGRVTPEPGTLSDCGPSEESDEIAWSASESEALTTIVEILQTATGVDFLHYKRASLARRIRRRLDDLGVTDLVAYVRRLREDAQEVTALFDTVLIQVTSFFREPGTFAVLQDTVIPPLLTGRSSGMPLRAWVVGCSTGQEAYSLAMSFLEVEANLGLEVLIRVFASDLSEKGLAKARAGQYSREEVAGLSPERLQRFFVPVDHGFQVTKRLREMCVFAKHDVTRDPPFGQLDLVFCSNLLIYLDQVLQRRVLDNLHYALKPSGYLVLGPAETTVGVEGLFSALDRKQKVYIRRHAPSRLHLSKVFAGSPPPGEGATRSQVRPLRTMPLQWSTAELQRAAEQVFFAAFPTASVLVNPELEVLHFQGQTGPYLEPPTGGPTMQLLRLARADLRLPLGRMLRRARKDQAPVRRRRVPLKVEGRSRSVDLTVLPVSLDDGEGLYYLVVFDGSAGPEVERSDPKGKGRAGRGGSGSGDGARLLELEAELAENREYLQAIIDQQDAAQAELQAAYEASLSINEEYQSTNEELESAKEEMQSLNEELATVNEQLHQRNAELQSRTAELNSLLESIDMPMLLVTRDLRIRAFNSSAAAELRLVRGQLGSGLAGARMPLPLGDLRNLIEQAIGTGEIQEHDLRNAQGRWQSIRVWPVDRAGGTETAALALVDIDRLKSDVTEAVAARAYSEAIVETVMEPLVVLDADLRMLHANRAFYLAFRTDAAAISGRPVTDLESGEWAGIDLRAFLEEARKAPRPLGPVELTIRSGRPDQRIFQATAGLIQGDDTDSARILLAMDDVTSRKLTEASALEASRMQAVGELAGGVAHEINNQMTVVLGFAEALLKQAGAVGPQSDDLARIVKAARRSADITGQLLAFSRRQRLTPVVLDLNAVIASNAVLLRRALGPDIELDLALSESAGRVRVDQAQLEQVLVNLSLNARDAMRGVGRLRIETTSVLVASSAEAGGGLTHATFARLMVSDTGAGMDSATQARIFEPFFTTKSKTMGTGLGLASVYGTVKQSGGAISVESEVGRGSTFTIDFPQVFEELAVARETPTAVPVGGTETIVVVEDEEAVRAWITRSLRDLGYTVAPVESAEKALRLLGSDRQTCDLLLTDVIMPGTDGTKLARTLAALRPTLPVLYMSGLALEELVRQGRLDGGHTLLPKPFSPEILAAAVRGALEAGPPGPEPGRGEG
jgi:two-component system CheB/CheR fusion protein